ncbi:unnamed protein product, partial [Iphiclides podalirius]
MSKKLLVTPCRQNGATVFLRAFRVRSKSVLRRSVDGPEPGRGQGLGAPWTPPPTRCVRPGREYRVRCLVPPWLLRTRTYATDYFGPRDPIRSCETFRARSFLAPARSRHSLGRAASRPPLRCAISEREDTATSPRGGAAADSDLAAQRPSVTASAPHTDRRASMARTAHKLESCLQFLCARWKPVAPPFVSGGARGALPVLAFAGALELPSELWLVLPKPAVKDTAVSIVERRKCDDEDFGDASTGIRTTVLIRYKVQLFNFALNSLVSSCAQRPLLQRSLDTRKSSGRSREAVEHPEARVCAQLELYARITLAACRIDAKVCCVHSQRVRCYRMPQRPDGFGVDGSYARS